MAKNVYYSQGIYPLKNTSKYKGSMPLCYRSHPEFLLCRWLDLNPNIIEWGSESVVIPYLKPTDGKVHRYFIDFNCVLRTPSGALEKYIIEYKPAKKLKQPLPSKRKAPKTLMYEMEEYAINSSKWDAAKQYATKHNMKFTIITEKELGIKV